ncbi:MAG: hypothetical protein C5B52_05130 [Bacteroidetes bacterium]|nr:MAG: hypothetical protein C5B52_05130 [Bacteroidota bacterium]
MQKYYFLFLLCLLAYGLTRAQDSSFQNLSSLPSKYFDQIDSKISGLDHKITCETSQYLNNLSRQEQKLSSKISKYDSSAAKALGNVTARYEKLASKMNTKSEKVSKILSGPYMPYLDSLEGSLSFLSQGKALLSESKEVQDRIAKSLEEVRQLKDKLNQTEAIKIQLLERQQQIKNLLSKYTNLPKNISKCFGKYQQDVYYYSQQIKELRQTLNDPSKVEQKLLEVLNHVPAFQDFISKNSMLASLFAPSGLGSNASVNPALQTRTQVQQLVQQRALAGGPNGQQVINQQFDQAKDQLNQLKSKLNQLGGASDGEMNTPSFTPNQQKTKSFWHRLEYGMNLQSSRGNGYFPVTSDFGFSLGYKINQKSIIGIGGSYKMGWGKDWNHMHISAEGLSLRSFIDWKVKGGWWLSGGAEMNYMKRISSLQIFKNYTLWQQSALLGFSKKYSLGKKFKGNAQALYDFLATRHVPRTNPFIFRVGYNF